MADDSTDLRRALTDLNQGTRALLGLGEMPELLSELLEPRDPEERRALRRKRLRRHLRLVPDPPDQNL